MGIATKITPPNEHVHVLLIVANFTPPADPEVAGGAHGPTMAGVHGMGVSTPIAADVALATAGFAML